MVVPIYTKAQLDKMCSGEQIAINEEGGKIYTFNENSIYLLKEDISFDYNGIWNMPTFKENGRIEGNGNKIKIKDTSKDEEYYYYYTDLNRYRKPLTEEGYLLSWDKTKVSTTKVEESTIAGVKDIRIVPIPEGFVMSSLPGENTVAGGLVIYQGTDKVTDTDEDGNDIIDAQENRNQFVWIPVDDINQMVMCKSNNSVSVCDLKLQENLENEIITYILRCEKHDSPDLCGRLYGVESSSSTVDGNTINSTNMNFSNKSQNWHINGNREPDIVSVYDTEANTDGLTVFREQITNDFINMATSVARYGGFYVSRYEAGENGASKKNQVVITTASSDGTEYKGENKWYGLYDAVRSKITVGTSTLQSHMIYGSQYDQIIYFLQNNLRNEPQIGHTTRQLPTQGLTGTNEADAMNNIYDLEGNNFEWTAQAKGSSYRVYRGGSYKGANNKEFYPAASCIGKVVDPTYALSWFTTRISFYL